MEPTARAGTLEVLEYLHLKLDAHFRVLHQSRQALEPTSPVFALEHDLGDADRELLATAVGAAVAQGFGARFHSWWLPFVVYAAEIGYDYVGVEYWPLFVERTPGWEDRPGWNLYGHRNRIKQWFKQFADQYGGARPTGAFADNFNIIAWPITHAVMPAYLQRQLAQLLYESRAILTRELLEDPDALGTRLASRTGSYSERFQIFCSNRNLLGQVAVALLSGEGEETPYLVPSTFHRLVEGLSREQQSRLWFTRARQSAHAVRSSGFRPKSGPGGEVGHQREGRREGVTDPKLLLRRGETGWRVYVELPDLTPLQAHASELTEEIRSCRVLLSGHNRPLARGRLMYPGEVLLSSWPRADRPFIQLEQGSETSNELIARRCSIDRGPWWLFRIRTGGEATEVKGKFVRPGNRYCLVGASNAEPPSVAWLTSAQISMTGVSAYELAVPAIVPNLDSTALQVSGITVVSEVDIRPAALVASAWDGEGAVEWLAGEPAILVVRSARVPQKCVVNIDGGDLFVLDWPASEPEVLFALEDLVVGAHEVEVSLLGAGGGDSVLGGSLLVTIRDPHDSREGNTAGEGIRLFATPARPKLTELWDGRATLSIDGPPGMRADVVVLLRSGDGRELARLRRTVELPLSDAAWIRFARQELRGADLRGSYDEAESCEVHVSRSGVGFASLACERGFRPLRWVVRSHRDEHYARLIDRTDGQDTVVQLFPVASPLGGEKRDPHTKIPAPASGGLLVATSATAKAAAVLPPDPNELRQTTGQLPVVSYGTKSLPEVMRLIRAHHDWLEADLPADPFAQYQQKQVLDAITAAVVSAIAGGRWAHLEARYQATDDPLDLLEEMQNLVGESASQRAVARQVADRLWRWSTSSEELASGFASVIGPLAAGSMIADGAAAAGFLLRLAGRPGRLVSWEAPERDRLLECVLKSPFLVRAARFAVLGTAGLQADTTGRAAGGGR